MLKKGHKPHPATLAALVLIRHVALASLNSSPAAAPEERPTVSLDNLDRWLALALECTLEGTSAPISLKSWLERARGSDEQEVPNSVLDQVNTFQAAILELAERGLDEALNWVVEEFKPLVAWSEDDELTISSQPQPLLRSSSLGLYVRRNYLILSRMDLDDLLEWWIEFERWVDGEKRGKRRAIEEDVSPEYAYSKARAREDYHQARELVRAFPNTANGSQPTRTSQEALLHLALLEYEDEGYGAARQALQEATRIARTVGDVACLAACRSLERRLDSAAPDLSRKTQDPIPMMSDAKAEIKTPHDLLWDIERQREAGAESLQALFPPLYIAHARYRRALFPHPPSAPKPGEVDSADRKDKSPKGEMPDPEWDAKWHTVAAGLWETMGISSLAHVHEELALEAIDPLYPTWDLRLSILARQARRLATLNKHDEALMLLLCAVDTREKRIDMGRREVRVWREVVVEIEMDRAQRRCDSTGARQLSVYLSGDTSVRQLRTPFSVDVESETEAVYTLLTRSATADHLADLKLDEPSRLAALIAISQLRVKAAGHPANVDAERSLTELESAWTALLALDEGGGDSLDGGTVQEGELLTRAREARAKLEITACSARDDLLPPIIATLDAVAQNYERLSLPELSARNYSFLAALCDHLSAGLESADSSSSTTTAADAMSDVQQPDTQRAEAAAQWRAKADEYDRRCDRVMRGLRSDGAPARVEEVGAKARFEKIKQVVDLIVEAVETSVQ
ncbi:hypothetical protein JCM10908_002082 [Rhodotorula pacifica]|uniref:uncharacterized protein n=1 Tax=Rhodotorula pacifica TaxID=1495444 RepID=UPI0031712B1D